MIEKRFTEINSTHKHLIRKFRLKFPLHRVIYFAEFSLVKRFSYILFPDKCEMIWVNDLFANENCHKKCKRGKMWKKCQMRPFS